MAILLKSDVLKISKINKATKAKFFQDLKVGDTISLSIPVKAAGGNGGTYASYITITNRKTGAQIKKSFNEIEKLFSLFELEAI